MFDKNLLPEIFWIKFRKRTDPEVMRTMYATTSLPPAPSRLVGKYDVSKNRIPDPSLLLVWDLEKKGIRSIPLDGIIEWSIDGEVWLNV